MFKGFRWLISYWNIGCLTLLVLSGFSLNVVVGFTSLPLSSALWRASVVTPNKNTYKNILKSDQSLLKQTSFSTFSNSGVPFLSRLKSSTLEAPGSTKSRGTTILSSKKLNEYKKQFSAVADDGLLEFQQMLEIKEIRSLLKQGDLEKEEVEAIWDSSPKFEMNKNGKESIKEKSEKVNLEGFLYIMEAIEDLFEEEEEDNEDKAKLENSNSKESNFTFKTFTTEQLDKFFDIGKSSKEVLLTKTRSTSVDVITLNSFMAIKEINEFLAEELLARGELFALWSEAVGVGEKDATKEQFLKLMKAIDDLFEIEEIDEENEEVDGEDEDKDKNEDEDDLVDDDEESEVTSDISKPSDALGLDSRSESDVTEIKNYIIRLLDTSRGVGIQDDQELDKVVRSIVPQLLSSPENYLQRPADDIAEKNQQLTLSPEVLDKVERSLVGKWNLLYTTSTNFRHAKGLSGLASTIPGGVLHSFCETFSRIENSVANVEMGIHREEQIKVEGLFGMFRGGNTNDKNILVSIDGYYEVKDSRDIITKLPTVCLDVEPQRIDCDALKIGTKMEGGWRSVRTLNRMEILYLDNDLRVMRAGGRGSYFIFKREEN